MSGHHQANNSSACDSSKHSPHQASSGGAKGKVNRGGAPTKEEMTATIKELIFSAAAANNRKQKHTTASWQRAPVGQPTADALVARSLLFAKPSPLVNVNNASIDWDEEFPETHWSLDDETLFYSRKLKGSAQNSGSRYHFDLNISLPIIVPDGEIRVLNSEGENYYHKKGDVAANILFGCYEPESAQKRNEHSDPTVVENETSAGGVQSSSEVVYEAEDKFETVGSIPEDEKPPFSVCDVWASFLSVNVGVIHNCHADYIRDITELFTSIMEKLKFDRPIEIQCSGVYGAKGSRYETKARYISPEDVGQFRVIRRVLKNFILQLRERYSVIPANNAPTFDATILPVCRTGEYLPIEIRRYSPLSASAQHLKGKNVALIDNKEVPLVTRCYINEVRLEMTHARTVDPRWETAWTLCRRMPMGSALIPSRHVFAEYKNLPKVVYQFDNPRAKLAKSRFGALYLLSDSAINLTRKAKAAENDQNQELNNLMSQHLLQDKQSSQLRAEAVPFFPYNALSQVLQQLQQDQPTQPKNAWDRLLETAVRDPMMTENSSDLLSVLKAGRA